jgi:hypothetical protein
MGFFEDLGNAAAAVVSTVGDVYEGIVETFTETAENLVDAGGDAVQDGINAVTGSIAAIAGPILGFVPNIVGGVLVGFIEMAQDITKDGLHILRDLGAITGALLRLDIPRVLEEILNLAIDSADLGVDLLRFLTGGYLVSAIADNFQREDLRAFVEDLLNRELANDPELDPIRKRLNISSGNWGLNFPANSHVMMFDTGTPGVAATIRQMHFAKDTDFDLFALANLLSFDSFSFNRPRTLVKVIEPGGSPSLFPINRFHISSFLGG